MTVPTISLRGPRQRTLPDRKGQRGRRAPASSSAGAGRSGGPKLRFGYLVFVMGVVLWVKAASAMSIRKDEIHQQLSAPLEQSPQQKLCPPGEEEKNCCTLINDTECRCKSGTFHGEDAPEFCQKYSTGCPDGKDMDMNSTLRSNIKGPSSLMIGIVTGIVITVFLIGCVVCYLKGPFNECWHKVIGFSSIWRPQTLSNCITAKPRVDTVFDKEADRRQRPVLRCSKQIVC